MNRLSPEVSQLFAQADLALWLSDWFRVPNAERLSRLRVLDEELQDLLLTAFPSAETGWKDALTFTIHDVMVAARNDGIHSDYYRLFHGESLCPPNETAYIRRDKGAILGDLCGFYKAFGFEPHPEAGERPDHIVCELEFVSLLLTKTAFAHSTENGEQRQVVSEACRKFAEAHLNDWLPLFCIRLQGAALTPWYRGASIVLHEAWSSLVQVNRWGEVSSAENVDFEPDASTPYECHYSHQ